MARRGRISNRTPARFLRQELSPNSYYIYILDEKGKLKKSSNGSYLREFCTYDANVPTAQEPALQNAVENVQSPSIYSNSNELDYNFEMPYVSNDENENDAQEVGETNFDYEYEANDQLFGNFENICFDFSL